MNTLLNFAQDGSVAAAARITYGTTQSKLGRLLVARSERGICAIFLNDNDAALVNELAGSFPMSEIALDADAMASTLSAVAEYIAAPSGDFDLPLDVQGTPFQRAVWSKLTEVPAGQTLTYSELAERVGNPAAVRAVASACAANRLAVAIPCHRALRRDGTLTGYRWGLSRKRALLDAERCV
jgi:AraC family transcriptional regulator, regulatory protein of adaptative response / methylated-DNA-[protein]-cysteine methyltransferase